MSELKGKNVAFMQNRIQPGGRFQVMAEMIAVLNEMGVVPDVICFSSRISNENIKAFYGRDLAFKLKLLKPEPTLPFEWNIWWFNRKVSSYLEDYDLVINHNNTSFGLNTTQPVLSYVHFPRKARLMSGLMDMHMPEKGRAPIINYRKDLFNYMRRLYRKDLTFRPSETLVANSEYTRSKLIEFYPSLEQKEVTVLYPPVDSSNLMEHLGDKLQVVSLGRIAPAKRQIEQLAMAAALPEVRFVLIGFIADKQYYKRCLNFIEREKLQNVEIRGDASQEELEEILQESRFFIHSMRNEPFGITPVQAIAKGCLPIVHNSGGQREVVNQSLLRYDDLAEAISKLTKLAAMDSSTLKGLLQTLQENIGQFGVGIFQKEFRRMLLSLPT